jgi:regulator of sirC expression with transglutaminase-like and TPR domain
MPERAARTVVLALAAVAFAAPACFAAPDPASRYRDCSGLAATDAGAALAEAQAWLDEAPEAAPARHCLALALVGLGRYADGAAELTRLAETQGLPDEVRARLFAQAGNGWLIAERPDLARAALERAVGLLPGDVELLIDRARAHAAMRDYWAAVVDLDTALESAPERDDALAFRAAAYRRLEVWELAAADAERAIGLNPANVEALVERAIVKLRGEDIEGARADFAAVLVLAPGSAAADLARDFLAELER